MLSEASSLANPSQVFVIFKVTREETARGIKVAKIERCLLAE